MNDLYGLSLHYPIEIQKGRNGGVSVSKGFIINGYIMKKEQLRLIANGLSLLKGIEPDIEIEALLKLIEPRK